MLIAAPLPLRTAPHGSAEAESPEPCDGVAHILFATAVNRVIVPVVLI